MKQTTDTVYFDGQCPLCSQEIAHLKRRSCSVVFIDAHSAQAPPQPKHLLLQQLHVVTATGETLIGLDANIYMWRNSGSTWLATFFGLPIVYSAAKFIYKYWAKRRYQKLYGTIK